MYRVCGGFTADKSRINQQACAWIPALSSITQTDKQESGAEPKTMSPGQQREITKRSLTDAETDRDRLFQNLAQLAAQLPKRLRWILFFPVNYTFCSNFTVFVSGDAPLAPDVFNFLRSMDRHKHENTES